MRQEKKTDSKKPFSDRIIPETTAFDLINKYGTYNIQDTANTANLFPQIAGGLPQKAKAFDTFSDSKNNSVSEKK